MNAIFLNSELFDNNKYQVQTTKSFFECIITQLKLIVIKNQEDYNNNKHIINVIVLPCPTWSGLLLKFRVLAALITSDNL